MHCCQRMKDNSVVDAGWESDAYDDPDILVSYISKFNEYGIIIHDGGSSSIGISYCPWCGSRLPESKRDEWHEALEKLGFDDPSEQDIPTEYNSEAWYQST